MLKRKNAAATGDQWGKEAPRHLGAAGCVSSHSTSLSLTVHRGHGIGAALPTAPIQTGPSFPDGFYCSTSLSPGDLASLGYWTVCVFPPSLLSNDICHPQGLNMNETWLH